MSYRYIKGIEAPWTEEGRAVLCGKVAPHTLAVITAAL